MQQHTNLPNTRHYNPHNPLHINRQASVYSDGVDDTKYLSLPDGLIKIVIPNNELTNTFKLLRQETYI